MEGIDTIVNEVSNIGITILCVVVVAVVVRWLDRNVFNKGRFDND